MARVWDAAVVGGDMEALGHGLLRSHFLIDDDNRERRKSLGC